VNVRVRARFFSHSLTAAETAAYMSTEHPEYETLAARIAVSNLHKETEEQFARVIGQLYAHCKKNGQCAPLIADDVCDIVMRNASTFQAAIDFSRDYAYSFFGFKTLCRSYLLRLDKRIVERPQHMLMRVAIGIHKHDIEVRR
jgi:ribonucleotide reductase alpha subunit